MPENEVPGLYAQLILKEPSQGPGEDEPVSIEMTIVPASIEPNSENVGNGSTISVNSEDQVKALYEAVSTCTALHPDPVEDEEDNEEDLPGAGGWITADNAGDYFDEDGQFVGFGENGQVVGSTRAREGQSYGQNRSIEDRNGTAHSDEEQQETKWRRLD